ncbi:MAG: hypothetical protein O2968_19655 [Acidobacteria bacterium]|nr:hypothetical protein [Acidobacteriota bacterium]
MPDVLVRDVPKKTVEALKRRAKRKNRSLQQEVKTILEGSAEGDLAERLESLRRLRERIRQRHPDQSDSTLIIREDRER